jgi:hypothetical protein
MTSRLARRVKRADQEQYTSREENADRAWRCAAFGLLPILFFLEIYATWLLLRVWLSREALDGKRRRRAWAAAALNLAVITGILVLVGGIIWGIHHTPANWYDLRTYPHPERMVGSWQRHTPAEQGGDLEVLELLADGQLTFRREGDPVMEGSGTWGYRDSQLLFRISRFTGGYWERRGEIISYGHLESLTDDVMRLKTAEGVISYSRRKPLGKD